MKKILNVFLALSFCFAVSFKGSDVFLCLKKDSLHLFACNASNSESDSCCKSTSDKVDNCCRVITFKFDFTATIEESEQSNFTILHTSYFLAYQNAFQRTSLQNIIPSTEPPAREPPNYQRIYKKLAVYIC